LFEVTDRVFLPFAASGEEEGRRAGRD
jgi:hypothetical protein